MPERWAPQHPPPTDAVANEVGEVRLTETDPVEFVRSLTAGRGADFTFEVVGIPDGFKHLIRRDLTTLRPLGIGAIPR